MAQLENIEAIQIRLWKSTETLRGNSELSSNTCEQRCGNPRKIKQCMTHELLTGKTRLDNA